LQVFFFGFRINIGPNFFVLAVDVVEFGARNGLGSDAKQVLGSRTE